MVLQSLFCTSPQFQVIQVTVRLIGDPCDLGDKTGDASPSRSGLAGFSETITVMASPSPVSGGCSNSSSLGTMPWAREIWESKKILMY